MVDNILKFIFSIPSTAYQFSSWLFVELPYINMTPIAMFGIAGFTIILVFHLIHLVNVISG